MTSAVLTGTFFAGLHFKIFSPPVIHENVSQRQVLKYEDF